MFKTILNKTKSVLNTVLGALKKAFNAAIAAVTPVLKKLVANKRVLIIALAVIVALAVVIVLIATTNARQYRRAERCIEKGAFREAHSLFCNLGDYKDAAKRAKDFVWEYDTYTKTVAGKEHPTVIRYAYDVRGNMLSKETTADGITTQDKYSYTVRNEVARHIAVDKDGNETLTETTYTYYDATKISSSRENRAGVITTTVYFYDDNGNLLESVAENTTLSLRKTYDAFGNVVKEVQTYFGGITYTTLRTFDDNGNPLTVKSASQDMEYRYDKDGRLIEQVTTADGKTVTTTYTYKGKNIDKSVRTDADGKTLETTYTYDEDGNLLKSENAKETIEYSGYKFYYRFR